MNFRAYSSSFLTLLFTTFTAGLLLLPSTSHAVEFSSAEAIVAADGVSGDKFGNSVAVSSDGNVVLIGAPNATVNQLSNAGKIYVNTKINEGWMQEIIDDPNPSASAQFGNAVALSADGQTAAVAYYSSAYKIHVFSKINESWVLTQTLTNNDLVYVSAIAISDDGSTLLAGTGIGSNGNGAVFFYSKTNGLWSLQQVIRNPIPEYISGFGTAIALSSDGSTLIAGAYNATVSGVASAGRAYIFTRSNNIFALQQQLDDPAIANSTAPHYFAYSVALSADGGTVLVGSRFNRQANIYIRTDNVWNTQPALLNIPSAYFETSVALTSDGTKALIGTEHGQVHVFSRSSSAWQYDYLIDIPGGSDDNFGIRVVVARGKTIAVLGSPGITINGQINAGSGYILQPSADLSTAIATDKPYARPGESFTYLITVTNTDQMLVAESVTLTDALPANVEFIAASQGCVNNNGIVACDLGSLPPNSVSQPAITVASRKPGTYKNVINANETRSFVALAGNTASTTITVDTPPTANDGSLTVEVGSPFDGRGTLTATDPDPGQTPTFSIVTQPKHGTVSLFSTLGAYAYTPENGFVGSDSFTFKANDGLMDSNVATVNITVTDTPPTALDGNVNTRFGTAVNGTLDFRAANSWQTGTFIIVAQPKHGTLELTSNTTGAFTYTPAQNFAGSDSFTFKVNDGYVDSNIATMTITVSVTPPTASNVSLTTTIGQAASGTFIGADPAQGLMLTFSVVTPPAHGSVSLTGPDIFTYTPAPGFAGSDSFTFKANNGYMDSNVATVNIVVNAASGGGNSGNSGGYNGGSSDSSSGGGGSFGFLGLLALIGTEFLRRKHHDRSTLAGKLHSY